MNRWKAAAIHLSLSILIAGTTTLFIRFILYPDYYFYLSGGLTLLFLIVGVDVVIGPLMTLVVCHEKKAKKPLIFDLCVIAILQLSALSYGIHTTWVGRPLYNVFVFDRFQVVTAVDLDQESLKKAAPLYQTHSQWGPVLIGVRKPTSPEEQLQMMTSGLAGSDIENFPQYYVPYDEAVRAQVRKAALPLSQLRASSDEAARLVDAFLDKRPAEDFYYLPIKGFAPEFMALILTKEGTPLTALPIDPWLAEESGNRKQEAGDG